MVSLGTGLFKTLYDPSKHNINKFNQLKYREKCNIIEEKIKANVTIKNKNEINNILSFNLVDSIR